MARNTASRGYRGGELDDDSSPVNRPLDIAHNTLPQVFARMGLVPQRGGARLSAVDQGLSLLALDRRPSGALGTDSQGIILLSQATFTELSEVLGRSKFDRYVTREERDEFLVKLLGEGTLVEISETIRECRDPKDNKFLEVAVSGEASCLVTGAQDLLSLNPFRGIAIMTPAQFLASLPRVPENGT